MSSVEGITIGYSGQCFPVRSLTKYSGFEDDGGAWLIAYKAEQRRRFKAVLCGEPGTEHAPKPRRQERARSAGQQSSLTATEEPKKLDGFYIMNTFYIDDPADICSLNINGKGLEEAEEEDFVHFSNVIHVDAGENRLPFTPFRKLSALRELEMPLNGLSGDIMLEENDFQLLEILDLSCNNLVDQDILFLGALPRLRVLHLSGNGIKILPQEMARTSQKYTDVDGKVFEVKRLQFPSLEKLHLDQNELTELSTFSSLAGLPRLRYLSLEGNQIASIPHLRLMGAQMKPPQPLVPEEDEEDYDSVKMEEPNKKTEQEEYHADDEGDEDTEDIDALVNKSLESKVDKSLTNINFNKPGLKKRMTSTLTESSFALHDLQSTSQPALPFSRLEHLNLANNIIVEEEGLLSLSSWPALKELEIWGNPLTTAFSGDPPIIAIQLGVFKGIRIVRKKPGTTTKPVLAPLKQKVKDELPAALRRRAKMLALEAPPKPPEIAFVGQHARPLPPISTAPAHGRRHPEEDTPRKVATAPPRAQAPHQPSGAWTTPPPERADYPEETKTQAEATQEEHVSEQEAQRQAQAEKQDDGFFLTQVADGGVEPAEEKTKKKEHHRKHRHRHQKDKSERVPSKYKGFEELLDIEDTGPDLIVPKDIQGSVRALQYALDHPLVFSEPTDQERTRRKRSKKKKAVAIPSGADSAKASKVEQLGNLLDKMRVQSKIIENNLEDVLKEYNANLELRQQYPEAKKLLKEIQLKYDQVRHQSMKSAREVQSHVTDIKGTVERAKPSKVKEKHTKTATYDQDDAELAKKMQKLQDIKDKIDSRI